MAGGRAEVNRDALSTFRGAVHHSAQELRSVHGDVRRNVDEAQQAIDEAEQYWIEEKERRLAEWERCKFAYATAEDGDGPDCSDLERAYLEAEQTLGEIQLAKSALARSAERYDRTASRLHGFLDDAGAAADAFLAGRISAVDFYLAVLGNPSSSATAGAAAAPARGRLMPPAGIEHKEGSINMKEREPGW